MVTKETIKEELSEISVKMKKILDDIKKQSNTEETLVLEQELKQLQYKAIRYLVK